MDENLVIIEGEISDVPRFKDTEKNGIRFCSFMVRTEKYYQEKYLTEYTVVNAWGKMAISLEEKGIQKGDRIKINGFLHTDKYEINEVLCHSTKVVIVKYQTN